MIDRLVHYNSLRLGKSLDGLQLQLTKCWLQTTVKVVEVVEMNELGREKLSKRQL